VLFHVREVEVEAVKFLWMRSRKHLEERNWKRKRTWKHLTFEKPKAEAFFIKHGASASFNPATIVEITYNKKGFVNNNMCAEFFHCG